MKKISILIVCGLIGMAGLTTSCSEDFPGPDPVDVTSNYSNKYWGESNLSLTYEGNQMTGKSVDFSTVKGETANITLYNVLPGEEVLALINIPITGDATGYSFTGNGTGKTTNCTFKYDGRVESGRLTVNLSDIKMAESNLMAKTYSLSDIIYGVGKDIALQPDGTYQWAETDGKMIAAPIYIDMDVELNSDGSFLHAAVTTLIRGAVSYMVGQLVQDITLEPSGYITANYTTDEMMLGSQKFSEINMEDETSMNEVISFVMYKLFLPYPAGGFQQQDILDATVNANRTYAPAPQGLAYWYTKNGEFFLKLDLPAILTQVMKSQGKTIDTELIATLAELILSADPVQLKSLLITINGQLNNSILSMITSMEDEHLRVIFSWLKDGIPMHTEQRDGHTYLYLTKESLTPFISLLPNLEPVMAGIPNFGSMLYESYILPLYEGWHLISKLNIGLELTANN